MRLVQTLSITWQHLLLIFFVALSLRVATFYFYIQHEERYCQADTLDYHISALGMARGTGMHRLDTMKPIFWRTPGYPLYLSLFYRWFGLQAPAFKDNYPAQHAALYFQIFLSSFIPLLILLLAFLLTGSGFIAQLVAWIVAVHPGFVLASTYLLTEGMALILFFGYLIFFYWALQWWFEQPRELKKTVCALALAAILLGLYTWMRPNGEFVVLLSSVIILLGGATIRTKMLQVATLLLFFYATIGAWYIRNHRLTGNWFFCPMTAPYLVSFSAPKIIRRIEKQPLDLCIKYALYMTNKHHEQQLEVNRIIKSPYTVPRELCCMATAREWIYKHPFYFMADWAKEVLKTSFDLYSSQLVALTTNCFKWDPLEEFLSEKLYQCLMDQKVPLVVHLIAWLELIFFAFIWLGILAGMYLFVIRALYRRWRGRPFEEKLLNLWVKTGLFVGGMVMMTGGFGYARLRLPVEPLMIISGLVFWTWIIDKKKIDWLTT